MHIGLKLVGEAVAGILISVIVTASGVLLDYATLDIPINPPATLFLLALSVPILANILVGYALIRISHKAMGKTVIIAGIVASLMSSIFLSVIVD